MITDFFITTIVVTTPNNSVLDETPVAPEVFPDRQPASAGALRVRLSAGTGATVTVAGYDGDSNPTSESFPITAGTTEKHGRTLFSQITTISVTGVSSGDIDVSAFHRNGTPITQETLVDSFMGKVQRKPEHKAGELFQAKFGEKTIGDYDLFMLKNPLVKEKHFIYDNRNKYVIEFVPIEISPLVHWLCDMTLLDRNVSLPTLP